MPLNLRKGRWAGLASPVNAFARGAVLCALATSLLACGGGGSAGKSVDSLTAVDDAVSVFEDNSVDIAVLVNDHVTNGESIALDNFTPPAHGTVSRTSDNMLTYTPAENFNGSDSFSYVAKTTGGLTASALVRVSILPVNDPPAPTAGKILTVPGHAQSSTIHPNDPDVDQTHQFEVVEVPAHGALALSSEGVATYTPNQLFKGTDTALLRVTDSGTPLASGLVRLQARSLQPNFVVIMTDDQRWDTLWAMPVTQQRIETQGISFDNAYVPEVTCCPSRASFISGGFYAHNTGVLNNQLPNGGAASFHDGQTLSLDLMQAGYRTALIGKYLNGYEDLGAYVPPGWSKWISTYNSSDWSNFVALIGSSNSSAGQGTRMSIRQYRTDYQRDNALEFIDQSAGSPFFLMLTFNAPHKPTIPAQQDENLFLDFEYAGRGVSESDISDKPSWVQRARDCKANNAEQNKTEIRNQLRTLQAVDRAVGAVMDRLQSLNLLENTVIFFTSDNGFMWCEHGIFSKGSAYEESSRVPLIAVVPGLEPRHDDSFALMSLDVPQTILELAGLSRPADGVSLLGRLRDPTIPGRDQIFMEAFGAQFADPPRQGPWAALIRKESDGVWKYVQHAAQIPELYDLTHDPYELNNQAQSPAQKSRVQSLTSALGDRKGLAVLTPMAPGGIVGVAYEFQIQTWGGKPSFHWDIVSLTFATGAYGRV